MVVLACAAVGLVFALVARRRSRFYRYAGGVALAGHLLLAVVVLPRLSYDWDVDVFHEVAVGILHGAETTPLSSLDAFGTFQAIVYAVFGTDPTTLAVANGLLAVLLPLPAAFLARRLYGPLESTDGVVAVVLFMPLPFLFNSLPMRDALSTLVALTALALCVGAIADRRYTWALPAAPLWGILFLLREELALLVLLGVGGALVVAGIRAVLDRDVTLATLTLASVPVGLCGVALFALLFPVDALNARLQYRASGGAAYLEFVHYESWLDVFLAAPVRAIYFQFAPFPLHVTSTFDLLAVLSLPPVIVLATTAYLSLRDCDADPVVAVALLVVYVAGVVGYGLIDSNFGTTIRHRAPFVVLLAVFSAPVLESWRRSLGRWIDEALGEPRQTDEQQRETQELDPGPQVRGEHGADAR